MILYPTLQLLDGQCVTLVRGNIDEPEVWHGDPVERALGFVEAGAEWLHVTDLDAVLHDTHDPADRHNRDLMLEILRVAGVPVQVSGGMVSDEVVKIFLDAGAGRIVFGASAVHHLDWVKAKAKQVPDYFAVSIDVWEGKVMTRGWVEKSMFGPEDMIAALEGVPLAAIIVTDIDRDIDLPDASFAMTTKLAEQTRTPIVSSGLVKTLDDVSTLRYMPNIAGAMIGRPLYDKTVDLAEALEIAKPAPERTAGFI